MNARRPCKRQSVSNGFTLVELMLATLIGAVLLGGALKLFVRSHAAWQSAENIAALEERAAYALTALEQDVQLAGYWGRHSDSHRIVLHAGVRAHCRGADVSAWVLQLAVPVEAGNGLYNIPCPAFSRAVGSSDTLTLRHVSKQPVTPVAGRIQLHTGHSNGAINQTGTLPVDLEGTGGTYDVIVNAWYLDAAASEGGLPALRRYALTDGGLMQNQEIIPGIEDFQVSLGVDRDHNGIIDGFVDPPMAADSPDLPGLPIVAVRFWLLLRSATPEPGHIDTGPWFSIDASAATPLRPGDGYRRIAAERTVWLRNRGGA